MEVLLLILLIVVVALAAFALWESRESRRSLETQLSGQRAEMAQSLTSSAESMDKIRTELEGVRSSATRILEVGKDISSLQDILRPPKLRGGFGEMLLERLLEQILPRPNYSFQHRFRSGEIVDAIIRLGPSAVPVDAKFPMESFNRVLAADSDEERTKLRREFARTMRGHVDSVARYIRPDEGTFDFALMYIPAENVYYETIVQSEQEAEGGSLQAYALERRVIPVSPNSFYAYLQAIVLGLRGMHVERQAQEIIAHLQGLKGDFGRFQEGFSTLGGHIRHAANRYDELERDVATLDHKLSLPLATEAPELPPGDGDGEAGE